MKRYLTLALCAVACLAAHALKYEYRFSDTPLSAALTKISRDHPELHLSFIYDELDNYRTSARIDTDNGLEAVRRLTTHIPVRVSQSRSGVYVEAMQRGVYRYIGRAVGDGGEGVSHATVMVLAPKDSTVLTYSFTDAAGRFSIPCDVRKVILKLSSVGYLTAYRNVSGFNVGDIAMTLAPVELGDITVKTERARMEPDKTVFLPGKREKNASHGGTDLLLAMGLPTVRVNPVDKAVTTNLGEEVATFIDFLPADRNELAAMRPQDVKRVEVYEYPADPRFNGARHVVNFIMVKYEYGGYTKGDASQDIPEPSGNFNLHSKFSYRKMTYDVSAGYFYEIDDHSRTDARQDYRFPEGDVSWLMSDTDRHYRHDTEYATLRAVYSDSRSVVSNTVGYQGNHSRFRNTSDNTYTPQIYPDDQSRAGNIFRSNSANWNGSYQFFLPRDFTLSISPTVRYSHHSSANTYTTDNTEIATDARENAWFALISADGSKKWGRNSLSASIIGELHDNKLHYVGSNLSRVHNCNDAVGIGLSARLYFGKLWLSPSASLYYMYQKFGDAEDKRLLPKYFISMGYNFSDRHQLTLSSEMSHWTVGVAQRSPNIVVSNLLDAITGNPSLTPTLYNNVRANYQWNVCSDLYLTAFCRYNRWTKPVDEVYTPVVIYGREMMLQSLEKDGYYSELTYGMSASAAFFNRSLSCWANIYGEYDRRGGKNRFSGNFVRFNAGVNYYLGNFYISAYYNAPRHSMSKGVRMMKAPSYYQLGAGWGANGLNVSVTAVNFLRTSTKGIYRECLYGNFSQWVQDYGRINAWGICFRISYSISYGRKVKQDNGPGSTGELGSGILR